VSFENIGSDSGNFLSYLKRVEVGVANKESRDMVFKVDRLMKVLS
jgi:hypothetical protein